MDRLHHDSEICCVCGSDVSRRSPLFANRVPDFNDYETRLEMGRRFPFGEWVCVICDNTDSDGVLHNKEDVEFSIKFSAEALRLAEHIYATRRNTNGHSRNS